MTSTKINGSNGTSATATLSDIISDVVLTSVAANKASAVLTVKNYDIEAEAQKSAIQQEVKDDYQTQSDNEKQYKKEHRHKLMHKIFGAIFHIIRIVVHVAQPRKMVKSITKMAKKALHPKDAMKSMLHLKKVPSLTKGLAKDAAKHAGTASKVAKIAERTANWGNVGLAAYDGIGKVQITKIKNDVEKLQIAKSVCESNYDMLEGQKKQEMQATSDRMSDVSSTMNTVSQMINRQSSMQSQIVSSI